MDADKKIIPWLSEPASGAPGEQGRYGELKILVIDDEPVNTELFEAILADRGYARVKSINDSRVALQTCRTFEPDLILLDLMMPHVDGIAILEALRSEPDGVYMPVIVLTADETEETRLRALDAGATDFMLKPFDLTEALLRIENLLALRYRHVQLDIQRAALEDSLRARTSELRDALSNLDKLTDSTR
jgi:putative two-component system response regulator